MMMGYLLAILYGMTLALADLSFDDWQFWVLFILYFCGRYLGYYEGRKE
jgi:hypothetical protein